MTQIEKYEAGNALALATGGDVFRLGEVLFQSGYFADVKSAAQAVVKILRGQELGIGPITAMENINVIKGKTALGAALIGAKIKSSGRYDYFVKELTDQRCELIFTQSGKEIGRSEFDIEDATKAGLGGSENYKKFPRNMLLARALTNGARWYCPDVFGGPVYDPSELHDAKETENVLDVPVVEAPKAQETRTAPQEMASRPVKRSVDAERKITEWWDELRTNGEKADIKVPAVDLAKSNDQLSQEHAEWLEKIEVAMITKIEAAEQQPVAGAR